MKRPENLERSLDEQEYGDIFGADVAADVIPEYAQADLFARERVEREQLFSDELMIDTAFAYHRAEGFPYRKLSPAVCMQELNLLANMDGADMIHSNLCYGVADTFHPHRMHCHATAKRSPYQTFFIDSGLRKAIKLELMRRGWPRVYAGGGLTLANGTQACSNFRPGFACHLYRRFAPQDAVVFDSSTGYGGRLVGAIAARNVKHYIGVDPNGPTHVGNLEMLAALHRSDFAELHNVPIEDFDELDYLNSCDFAFTSPPYFIKEQYSEADTQSWKRYPELSAWVAGFLVPMFEKQYAVLKRGARSIVNIAPVKINNIVQPLDELAQQAAEQVGFSYEHTEAFPMVVRLGANQAKIMATEPVLIFRKP